jgi:HPt (histidine-containing phosphotransfer) domain-containing protein
MACGRPRWVRQAGARNATVRLMPRGPFTALAPACANTSAATALRPRFLERRRRDVGTLRAALERGDFETIGTLGHNLRGNGVSYGFPDISAMGARLELAAAAGNAVAVRAELASLDAWLAGVEQ